MTRVDMITRMPLRARLVAFPICVLTAVLLGPFLLGGSVLRNIVVGAVAWFGAFVVLPPISLWRRRRRRGL